MKWSRMVAALTGGAGLAVALASLNGCASYETYPAVPKNIALNDPNTMAMTECIVASLRWVASKFPPGGESVEEAVTRNQPTPFAINLLPTTTYRTYERVAEDVGMGAVPLSESTANLPTYHISYVRVRGDEAQVHVIRPVMSLGAAPGGKPIPQEIKLQLRGGLRPWHVIGFREWEVGIAETPEPNFYHPPGEVPARFQSRPTDAAYVPNPPANSTTTKTAAIDLAPTPRTTPPAPSGTPAEPPATAGAPE